MITQTIKTVIGNNLDRIDDKAADKADTTKLPTVRKEILTQLQNKYLFQGHSIVPCIPSLLDESWLRINRLFETLEIRPTQDKLEKLRQELIDKINQGFQDSPHAKIKIKYKSAVPPERGLIFNIAAIEYSVVAQYQDWLTHRSPPLFGSHPDAKLMAVVTEITQLPQEVPVLDIGAGTGRNTIPLAKLGYPVDAIELTPEFAKEIRATAQKFKLPVRVIQGDILNYRQVKLKPAHYKLIVIAEVIPHLRSTNALKQLLATICDLLSPGGLVLFNSFLPIGKYEPDIIAREIAASEISSIFTRSELAWAMEKLPLEIISDQSAFEFERQHQPIEAWPPTGWYCNWATGRDVFWKSRDRPPIELRWLLCRRS